MQAYIYIKFTVRQTTNEVSYVFPPLDRWSHLHQHSQKSVGQRYTCQDQLQSQLSKAQKLIHVKLLYNIAHTYMYTAFYIREQLNCQ